MRPAVGILAAAVAAALLCGGARAADDPYAALLAPAETCGPASEQVDLDPSAAELVMLCLTNYARTQSGLQPLGLNWTLNAAGDAKLAADVECGVFSHEPCGQSFDAVFSTYTLGATSFRIGENIAWGTGSFSTPLATMNAWLHSAGHRENILEPSFRELGIGYLDERSFQGYDDATLWSQQFGVRAPATAAATSGPQVAAAKPKPKPPAHKKKPARKKPILRVRHRRTG
jgi:uncharacterized protein YkwD